jgi:excisionase family DNA binding protein
VSPVTPSDRKKRTFSVEGMSGSLESYLFKLVAWRKIPHTKLGRRVRFDEDRLAEWLQEHAIEPVAPTAPRRHGRVA